MATYNEFARTNLFTVKDRTAFLNDLDRYNIADEVEVLNGPFEDHNTIRLRMSDGIPAINSEEVDVPEHEQYGDLIDLIIDHLADGSLCILTTSWSEGMHGCGGTATAFDNTGSMVAVDTNEIYARAKEHFDLANGALCAHF